MSSIHFTPAFLHCCIAILASATISCGGDDGTGPTVPVAVVTVTPTNPTIAPGGTVQLQAATEDAGGATLTGREITWASSDNAVVTVSETGLVTGVAEGTATVTATSEGKSGTTAVTVHIPVASVVVQPDAGSIPPSDTLRLNAVTRDAAGNPLADREVSWASSNSAVATVSETGLVTAVAEGTATITATSEGQSGSAVITVVTPPDMAGHWVINEEFTDQNLGFRCENSGDVTLDQTGATFTGSNEQTGSCTFETGETNDNSGTFQITNGLIGEFSEQGWAISFTEPGAVSCNYQGTLLPPVMSGTVSCAGFVEGLGQVNASGTWCAERVGGSIGAARAAAVEPYNASRRIPTCT